MNLLRLNEFIVDILNEFIDYEMSKFVKIELNSWKDKLY